MDEKAMAAAVRKFLDAVGETEMATERAETPERVAITWNREILSGYRQDPADFLKPFAAPADCGTVIVKDIEFVSVCVHHLLPFFGRAHIAYQPGAHLVGVSKVARLVDCYSRRLQIQERLTRQIGIGLMELLKAQGTACVLEARHLCMMVRGVRKRTSRVITSSYTGCFEETERRREIVRLMTP